MSEDLSNSENSLIDDCNSQLSKEMPEDCIPKYKKFLYCKTKVTDYLQQTLNHNQYTSHFGMPGQFTFGCAEEYKEFSGCYTEFKNQYDDLKNYVALIENKPHEVVPGADEIFKENMKRHALIVSPLGIINSRLY
jgi:hypothetical protein